MTYLNLFLLEFCHFAIKHITVPQVKIITSSMILMMVYCSSDITVIFIIHCCHHCTNTPYNTFAQQKRTNIHCLYITAKPSSCCHYSHHYSSNRDRVAKSCTRDTNDVTPTITAAGGITAEHHAAIFAIGIQGMTDRYVETTAVGFIASLSGFMKDTQNC